MKESSLIWVNRDLAAAAAANGENPAIIAPATMTVAPPPASTLPSPVKKEARPATASWSDALGFWAWKQGPQKYAVPAELAVSAATQEASAKSTVEEQIKKP